MLSVDVEIGLLKLAHLKPEQLTDLGVWLGMSTEDRANSQWPSDCNGERMGLDKKPRAEQLRMAAAAFILAAEQEDKSPFDLWYEANVTLRDRTGMHPGQTDAMRKAFEAGRNG